MSTSQDHEVKLKPSPLGAHEFIKECNGWIFVFQTSVVLRVSRLPLVRTALQSVTSAYTEVKGRYPLLSLMGGMAEVGVRSVSHEAMRRATPLLQSLEPQSMQKQPSPRQ